MPDAHRRGARAPRPRRADRRRQRRLERRQPRRRTSPPAPAAGVTLVEQPLPAGDDAALAAHRAADPGLRRRERARPRLARRRSPASYDAVNIKLDKTGGLTEALALAAEAERLGFAIMVGCMVATSLAMAPAMLLAQRARFVDLDGPLLLARTARTACATTAASCYPPTPALWG